MQPYSFTPRRNDVTDAHQDERNRSHGQSRWTISTKQLQQSDPNINDILGVVVASPSMQVQVICGLNRNREIKIPQNAASPVVEAQSNNVQSKNIWIKSVDLQKPGNEDD